MFFAVGQYFKRLLWVGENVIKNKYTDLIVYTGINVYTNNNYYLNNIGTLDHPIP